MSRIRKAVIPAAGLGTRFLPASKSVPKEMLPVVDKPVIQYIVEGAVESGIEEVCIVASEENVDQFRRHFRGLPAEWGPLFRGKAWALEEAEKLAGLTKTIRS